MMNTIKIYKKTQKEIKKCSVEGCTNTVLCKGICNNHYKIISNSKGRCQQNAGIYIIWCKEKFYIGYSFSGLKTRYYNEKYALIKNKMGSLSNEFLDYFNSICEAESSLSRKEILNKYVHQDIIEEIQRWTKIDENFNYVEYSDDKEKGKLLYKVLFSTNAAEVIYRNDQTDIYLRTRERLLIKHAKELDRQNGTTLCLNVNN